MPLSCLGRDGLALWCNQAYADMVGLTVEQVLARGIDGAIHPDDVAVAEVALEAARTHGTGRAELRTRHADDRWLQVSWAFSAEPDGELIAAVAVNVTDHRAQARQLRHEARHDPLTGLVNRTQVVQTLQELADTHDGVTVAIVDLDRFKVINDRLGHRLGDAALQAMADRLRGLAPEEALVGRLGGDEFIVVLPGRGPAVIDDLAARLSTASGPVQVEGRQLWLSSTCGLSDGQAGGVDDLVVLPTPDDLLLQADRALLSAKQAGRGRARIYDDELWVIDRRRRRTEEMVLAALRSGGVGMHLQPIVCVAGGEIQGVEALARLDQGGSVLEAGWFMDVVADLGLAAEISAHVRRAALREVAGMPGLDLYLNLDAEDLLQPGAMDALLDMAEDEGVGADRIVLELTEVLLLEDVALAAPQLAAAGARGARIAIDDFGVGTSSLAQISGIHVDVLKVDRSFVVAARQDVRAQAVMRAMLALGQALDVRVVIEGVEAEVDVDLARALGADAVQGYHVGRPMSADALRRVLADRLAG